MSFSSLQTKLKAGVMSIALAVTTFSSLAAHPNLVITEDDVVKMRGALDSKGFFSERYHSLKAQVDQEIVFPIVVPVPKDGGGGYTHERHKKNYQLMYRAGIIYQLSQEQKYADYVRDMLLEYACLVYPSDAADDPHCVGLGGRRVIKKKHQSYIPV